MGLPSLREFTIRAYKDPVWIIAALLFVTVFSWGFSFWISLPDRILELEEPSQRRKDFIGHQRLVLKLQEQVNSALQSESAAIQFIHDKGIPLRSADAKQCAELIKEAQYKQVTASGAVEATEFHDPFLAEVQSGMQRELQCVNTMLEGMAEICGTKNVGKSDSLLAALFSDSLRCLSASQARRDSFDSDAKTLLAKDDAAIKSENARSSILRFELRLLELAVLYLFGFVMAVVLGWDRLRRRHIREGKY